MHSGNHEAPEVAHLRHLHGDVFSEDGLRERIAKAVVTAVHPLAMVARDDAGRTHKAYAINEVSLLRQSYQAAKLRIDIDGQTRLDELICDGLLVATPAGSTWARAGLTA